MAIIIEWAIFALLSTFIFTQIIYPLFVGKPLFSLFRSAEKAKLEALDAYTASESELELLALEQRKKDLEEKITKLKKEINREGKVGRRSKQ